MSHRAASRLYALALAIDSVLLSYETAIRRHWIDRHARGVAQETDVLIAAIAELPAISLFERMLKFAHCDRQLCPSRRFFYTADPSDADTAGNLASRFLLSAVP